MLTIRMLSNGAEKSTYVNMCISLCILLFWYKTQNVSKIVLDFSNINFLIFRNQNVETCRVGHVDVL